MSAAAAALFDERPEPGGALSFALAALVHVLLLAVLVFGVRWQNPPPLSVAVELWEPPAPPPAAVVEPAPPPKPVIEKPAVVEKPEIVEKKAPPPKPVVKPAPPKPAPPKPVAKAEPPKPAPPSDAAAQRRLREELDRERAALEIQREQASLRDLMKRDAIAGDARARAAWVDKIRAKIRGNILLPQEIKGNPEAIFDVVQLPTGEVLSAKLRKSSGHRAYDEAVERAILKSSPLPKPDKPGHFERALELKFRPFDPL